MTYEEVRCRLAEAYGWSFDDIDDMSFEQIDSARRGGKPPGPIPVHSAEDVRRIAREWRSYYGV